MRIQKFLLVLFMITIGCGKKSTINTHKTTKYKTIDSLFNILRNNSSSNLLKINSISKLKVRIDKIENDSIKLPFLVKLSYFKLLNRDFQQFRQLNEEILKIDSKKPLNLNTALAYEYLGNYSQQKYKSDSAFYFFNKASNVYKELENTPYEGKMLLSMAAIQTRMKDFTGSEINSIKAIQKLRNSKQQHNLYLAHNNLGVVYKNLNRFDLAIKHLKKAVNYSNKKEPYSEATLSNTIGGIYVKKNDHLEALKYYKKGLATKGLQDSHPNTYAMLLNNFAHSKFKLGQYSELPDLYYKSLQIRDSLQMLDGIVEGNLKLADYFLTLTDTLKAKEHCLKANNKSKEFNYSDGLLDSYLFLSKIEPGVKGQKYLEQYIKISDSLHQHERKTREKFTRIAYDTDEIIVEKEAETKQKWQVILLSGVGASFSLLFFIYRRQRSRNKELEYIQEQDKANVEIYNLMLSQQTMFNKGSTEEKNRISKELHDDILGRIFGTRLSLDALNESSEEDAIADREKSIEDLQLIEEDIRKISHNLYASQFSENMSFEALVQQLLEKQSNISTAEFHLSFNKNLQLENVSNTIKINCYRILQESIQNINKYSKATLVNINFSEEHGTIVFSIEDNGIGFNLKNTKKGIGIKNIKSRVKDLKGQVEFISKPKHGTSIHIKIPILNESK